MESLRLQGPRALRRCCGPAGLLLGMLMGSAGTVVASTEAQRQAESLGAVMRLIGAARCNSDADCRTVPIGHRACGGPEAFLAWSIRDTDPVRLQQAVARHEAVLAAIGRPGQRFSTCEVLVDPGARCVPGGGAAAPEASGNGSHIGTCRLQTKQTGGRGPLR